MINYTVFVVDDESTIREGIAIAIGNKYQIHSFGDAESALEKAKSIKPDLVLLDIGLPGLNGIQALKKFKEMDGTILAIMITAYEDIQSVIESMKIGAYDYIIKPIHLEGLEITIANALDTLRLKKEIEALQNRQIGENVPCYIGESNAVHDLKNYIRKVARSPDTPILLLGDTGTGKELIAHTIHYRSPNHNGPFVPVNCAAIPKDLFESELFGYEKGAFSGASQSGKKGLIEMAAEGTLFLDEIGEMDPDMQAKLLRFMEDGELRKVGGTRSQKVRTRIVSATNQDLEQMIEKGTFRKDLFFRIGVIRINVPSLNERRDDIHLIARFFLQVFNEKFNRHLTGIADEALQLLKLYNWSGNVRELKNMMERAALIANGPELTAKDLGLDKIRPERTSEEDKRTVHDDTETVEQLPPSAVIARTQPFRGDHDKYCSTSTEDSLPPQGIDLNALRTALDAHYFTLAMQMSKGNESHAARLLGLKQHTFRYQYKKLFPDS